MSEYSTSCGNCGLPTLIDIAMVQCGECGAILCVDCRQTRHCKPAGTTVAVPVDNAIYFLSAKQMAHEPIKTVRLPKS